MPDEKVLSQANIDAMLATSAHAQAASSKSRAAVPQKQTIPKNVPSITPKIRVAPRKTEMPQSAAHRTQEIRRGAASYNEVELLRAVVVDLTNRLIKIETAMSESQRTFDSGINKMFRCNSCDSQGLVSFNTRCTKCGKQQWWGWWPKK